MKHIAILSLFCAAYFALQLMHFSRGYFVVLAPFLHLTPLIGLTLLAVTFGAAIALILQLLFGKGALRHKVRVFSVAAVSTLVSSFIPSTGEAFRHRMSQLSQEEWVSLASQVRAGALAKGREGRTPQHWNRDIARELARTNPVLALGDWPPKLLVSEDGVGIFWGSGLIGTLGVSILEAGVESPVESGFYRYSTLYPRVVVVTEGVR